MPTIRSTSLETFTDDVLNCALPALVYYSAPWCGPCAKFGPIVQQVAAESSGTLAVFKVDLDAAPDLAQKYSVMGVPTVHLFTAGQLVSASTGASSKARLLTQIDEALH